MNGYCDNNRKSGTIENSRGEGGEKRQLHIQFPSFVDSFMHIKAVESLDIMLRDKKVTSVTSPVDMEVDEVVYFYSPISLFY